MALRTKMEHTAYKGYRCLKTRDGKKLAVAYTKRAKTMSMENILNPIKGCCTFLPAAGRQYP